MFHDATTGLRIELRDLQDDGESALARERPLVGGQQSVDAGGALAPRQDAPSFPVRW